MPPPGPLRIFGVFFIPSWLAFHVVVGFVVSLRLAFHVIVWFGTSPPRSGGVSSESLLAFVTRAGAVLLAVAPPVLLATFVSLKLRRG